MLTRHEWAPLALGTKSATVSITKAFPACHCAATPPAIHPVKTPRLAFPPLSSHSSFTATPPTPLTSTDSYGCGAGGAVGWGRGSWRRYPFSHQHSREGAFVCLSPALIGRVYWAPLSDWREVNVYTVDERFQETWAKIDGLGKGKDRQRRERENGARERDIG